MVLKVLVIAGWAAVSVVSSASAQSLAGPAETPPSSFKGSQYVDSRGCVFLRAGIGGRVTWVPRVSRDRQALCGQSPAAAAREAAVVAPPVAPVKAPNTYVGAPMETIASLPRNAAAQPRVVAKPAAPVVRRAVVAPTAQAAVPQAAGLENGCPAGSPYGARVTLTDGRRSLICSADPNFDVSAAAAKVQSARATPEQRPRQTLQTAAPAYTPTGSTAGAGYKCPASAPVAKRFALRSGGSTVMCTDAKGRVASATPPLALGNMSEIVVPKGYRKAWEDDRLNPQRGIGSAHGQTQQDRVWSRDIPAQLIADAAVSRAVSVTATSNAPRDAVRGGLFIQIGLYGEPANAARNAARLQGLGLPVVKSRVARKGRSLQLVLAGPFGDSSSANAALSKVRRSGFGDAFIR